jgi:hypothetical protein
MIIMFKWIFVLQYTEQSGFDIAESIPDHDV